MADEGTAAAIFPPPPPFYKQFTASNLARLKELKDAQTATDGAPAGQSSLLDLPPELRCLVPPEAPADGIYRSFGEEVDVRTANHRYLPKAFRLKVTYRYATLFPPCKVENFHSSTLDQHLPPQTRHLHNPSGHSTAPLTSRISRAA
jgi:hypothetical protein